MKNMIKITKSTILISAISVLFSACASGQLTKSTTNNVQTKFPNSIKVEGIAQNPEGIEYDKNDKTFLLSSLNAAPILKVGLDGTAKLFTSGEKFPLSTAGIQIDYANNRLLVAGFNGLELMDKKPETKGTAFLRVYNLTTGVIEKEVNLSHLVPEANAYFANDVAVDNVGNVYISDWYANVVYKVDLSGKATVFWKNNLNTAATPNGLDFHPDGYLLVSIISPDGSYKEHALVKVPLNDSNLATEVRISNSIFAGFDGMVVSSNGNVIGITNNQKSAGGNILIELTGENNWQSAKVINSKDITTSTTVAITPENKKFVINQDFMHNFSKTWMIEQIKF